MWMDIIKNIGLQQAGNCFICIGDILAGGDLQLLCTGSAFTAFFGISLSHVDCFFRRVCLKIANNDSGDIGSRDG